MHVDPSSARPSFDLTGKVAILDVQADKAAAKAAALGPGHSAAGCDVTDPESVRASVARLAPAEELSVADWDATMSVNVRGTFLMCQQAGAVMLAAGRGRIVNLASQAATVAQGRGDARPDSRGPVRRAR